MSHVAEGRLHAYLDGALPAPEREAVGAHVRGCSVCAERLAEAERLREQSRFILAAAAPQPSVPPFAELTARSQGGVTRRSAPRGWQTLSWAASVAFALLIGWYARDLLLAPLGTTDATPPGAPAGAPAGAVGDAAPGAGVALDSAAATPVAGAARQRPDADASRTVRPTVGPAAAEPQPAQPQRAESQRAESQ
ncbi:MAG: anti-sigma factor family protein, partial [Longimicrobiales bacterium]